MLHQNSEVFLSPLFTTFIPSKLFEILACGVPVAASLAGEAAEILERSGGAVVVPPEDVVALDGAIDRLRRDPDRRRRMGIAGARFVREHYDRARLADEYLGHLERIAAPEGGR